MASETNTNKATSIEIDNNAIFAAFGFHIGTFGDGTAAFSKWDNWSLTYDLKQGVTPSGESVGAWSSDLTAAILLALADISAISNLTFSETSSGADIDFWSYSDDGSDTAGYSYTVGGSGVYINESSIYTEDDGYANGLEYGGTNYGTVIHEILHNLGMAHPHDSYANLPGVIDDGDNGDFSLNQDLYTVMSYNSIEQYDDEGNPTTGWPWTVDTVDQSFSVLGAFDIAFIQALYGANYTTATGDDVYVIPEFNQTGTYFKSIWDAGGDDLFAYYGSSNINIDLRAATLDIADGILAGGGISRADGIYGGFTIAKGTIIENALSGAGDDVLHGNYSGNVLSGRGGDDTYIGEFGNDELLDTYGDNTFDGGYGHDKLRGYTGYNTMDGGLGNDYLLGGVGRDQMDGGDGDDVLRGDFGSGLFFGADLLDGGTGNDTMMGGGGADVFRFGINDGSDTIGHFDNSAVSYSNSLGYSVLPTGADFEAGLDQIELVGFGTVTSANVLSFIIDGINGAIFSAEGTNITFYDISAADLSAGDFLFS